MHTWLNLALSTNIPPWMDSLSLPSALPDMTDWSQKRILNKAVISPRKVCIWNLISMPTWMAYSPKKEIEKHKPRKIFWLPVILPSLSLSSRHLPTRPRQLSLCSMHLINQQKYLPASGQTSRDSVTFGKRGQTLDSASGLLTTAGSERQLMPGS